MSRDASCRDLPAVPAAAGDARGRAAVRAREGRRRHRPSSGRYSRASSIVRPRRAGAGRGDLPWLRRRRRQQCADGGAAEELGLCRAGRRQLLLARPQGRLRPPLADPGRCREAGLRYRCRRPWLDRQDFVKPSQRAFMGYSYGGGVGLLRTLSARTDARAPTAGALPCWSIPIAGWARRSAPSSRPRQPTMIAMGALDDWTPIRAMRGAARPYRRRSRAGRDACLSQRASQLRRARPAGALPRRRRQPQQAGRLLRRALRRQRGGVEGLRGRRARPSWRRSRPQ